MALSSQLGNNKLGAFMLGGYLTEATTKPELMAYDSRKPTLMAAKGDD